MLLSISIWLVSLLGSGCEKQMPEPRQYQTQRVVMVVIDGPRYTETWGCTDRCHIPTRKALAGQGVVASAFSNDGVTYTTPGHTAITTGVYQNIDNSGAEYPHHPSMFQLLASSRKPGRNPSCKIITSKDKLEVLSDCTDPEWKGQFRPQTDCGNNGLGTGNRPDSITFQRAMEAIQSERHQLLFICFREPDTYGHANDWANYIRAIDSTDAYTGRIYDALQKSSYYAGKTTFIVTNDHGRHPDDFTSHGDGCDGCRHIEFLGIGPDFRSGHTTKVPYDQRDISATIAELLGFEMSQASKGEVMWDLFK